MAMRAGVRPAYLSNRLKRGCQAQLYRIASARDTDSVRKHISACVRWDHEGTVLHAISQLVFMGHRMLGGLCHLRIAASRNGNHKKRYQGTRETESI